MQDGGWCVGFSWRATMGDHEALWWCGVVWCTRETRTGMGANSTMSVYIYIYEASKLLQFIIQNIADRA